MSQAYPTQNYPRQGMSGWKIFGIIMLVIVSLLAIAGGIWWSLNITGRNVLVEHSNNVDEKMAGVDNGAQKRADITKNMVAVVERFTKQEKDVLIGTTEARAKATSITLPKDATPEQVAAFKEAQGELSIALGRLLAVSERYPELKSDKLFLDLQKQLKDNEVQMSGARAAYIHAVRAYNNNVQKWPWNGYAAEKYGYVKKPQYDFGPNAAVRRSGAPDVIFKE